MSVIEDAQRTVPWVLTGQAERCGSKHIARITGKYAGELTYGELLRAAETGSTGLREEFGVQVGEVAGVFMPNSVDFLTAWFSCLYAGVIDAAINYELKKGTLLTALSSMSVRAVFTDGDGFERLLDPEVSNYLARLKVIVLSGVTSPTMAQDRLRDLRATTKVVLLSDLLASGPRKRLWETLDRSSLASIRYTSGTTGLPKGVMHTHAFLLNKSANHGRAFTLGSDDVLYSPFPLYHGLSGIMGVIGALQAGATFATTSRFSASGYWNDCRTVGATLAHILFPMVPMLMKQPPSDDDRRHHVRYLYAAWPNAEFRERFGAEFIQMYAQTEVGIVAYRREGSEEGSRCVGRPIDVMEVRIVDDQDRAVAPGTVGEIAVRPRVPDNIMSGYYDNYAATARTFRNLWHHTGDAGYLTDSGELYYLGRLGDTIRRRGVNMSSEQLDNEIVKHPNVLECAVIGVPADLGEEEVHACIVWREPPAEIDAALAELFEFLKSNLPRQYVPRYVEILDSLPKTSNGKVRKNELRSRAEFGMTWDREAARPGVNTVAQQEETHPPKPPRNAGG